MTVHFIGAGPGAPDLLTLRGRDLIARCPVCLYAGSLVPKEIIAHAPAGARIVDTAPLTLEEIVAEFQAAHAAGQDVARLHSGDLSVYSALGEQTRALRELGIPYTITPGVPAFAAASAALGRELTLPEVSQTLILTRTEGRASAMPANETLEILGASGATLAVHLSIHVIDRVVERLTPLYGADCPAAVVYRATWPAWVAGPGDRWIGVPDIDAAAQALRGLGDTVFLTIGRQEVAAFEAMPDKRYLIRAVDPPEPMPALPRMTLILDRGPFTVEGELALMRGERVEVVVSKNSGGRATDAKLEAARRLGLPVVMVERPAGNGVAELHGVDEAVGWLEEV